MLAFAVFYFIDKEKETDFEILLTILAEANSQLAALLRLLIKLQKIWQTFLDGWNATIGPLVADITNLADDLTGGVLSEFGVVMDELKLALKLDRRGRTADLQGHLQPSEHLRAEGVRREAVPVGRHEPLPRPSALCQGFVKQANLMRAQARQLMAQGERDAADQMQERAEQFLAFAMGYMTHVGTDTVAHSFVNAQCGGPYPRPSPAPPPDREPHQFLELCADRARRTAGARSTWGCTDDYPNVSQSALWFAIQLTPDNPQGVQRPVGPVRRTTTTGRRSSTWTARCRTGWPTPSCWR